MALGGKGRTGGGEEGEKDNGDEEGEAETEEGDEI